MRVKRDVYMVLVNAFSGSVFVKTIDFFRTQGGFDWEKDPWGKNWVPIVATSIEDAREKGCAFPGARPYEMQTVAIRILEEGDASFLNLSEAEIKT